MTYQPYGGEMTYILFMAQLALVVLVTGTARAVLGGKVEALLISFSPRFALSKLQAA